MINSIPIDLNQLQHSAVDWKQSLSNLLRDPEELCDLLALTGDERATVKAACGTFPLRIPRPYLSRMTPGDVQDPLLLQVLPQAAELVSVEGYTSDPLEEAEFTPIPGLLHKYHGRVLVVLNGSCAIHCRYCFRRHFPYQAHQVSSAQWGQVLQYIAADDSVTEVIFSGGDPLTCNDTVLSKRCADLAAIPHLKTLRLHTRLPIMIPQRIDHACLEWMAQTRLQIVMVIHSNHAQEIDHEVATALTDLASIGVVLLNQSVLLAGINDSVAALESLSRRLLECRVLPYYLHLLDKVTGAAHFDVAEEKVRALRDELSSRVPGYMVPKFVREQANEANKTPLE
ncbi:MAG: EF-P beta-lysylation protein EpmB [Proteobacteria bacterium]|nr:MAG: EF-P beta-lysylation protein EpmB [Pseudomonadota bacterium]